MPMLTATVSGADVVQHRAQQPGHGEGHDEQGFCCQGCQDLSGRVDTEL